MSIWHKFSPQNLGIWQIELLIMPHKSRTRTFLLMYNDHKWLKYKLTCLTASILLHSCFILTQRCKPNFSCQVVTTTSVNRSLTWYIQLFFYFWSQKLVRGQYYHTRYHSLPQYPIYMIILTDMRKYSLENKIIPFISD